MLEAINPEGGTNRHKQDTVRVCIPSCWQQDTAWREQSASRMTATPLHSHWASILECRSTIQLMEDNGEFCMTMHANSLEGARTAVHVPLIL